MKRAKRKLWPPQSDPPRFPGSEVWELQRFFSVPAPVLYRVPEELEPLATRLGLPVQEVVQLMDDNGVPLRRRLNKNRRPYGSYRVLIHDVLKIEGVEDRNPPPEGRLKENPWRK